MNHYINLYYRNPNTSKIDREIITNNHIQRIITRILYINQFPSHSTYRNLTINGVIGKFANRMFYLTDEYTSHDQFELLYELYNNPPNWKDILSYKNLHLAWMLSI